MIAAARSPAIVGMLAMGLSLTACDRIAAFSTGPEEAFCGQVSLGSAYRQGFSPRVQMRLQLDAEQLGSGNSPGVVSTYDAGLEEGARLIDQAPLRPIAPLAHDPLSQLEFGDGRERNYMFALTASEPEQESVLAVLSLRTDDTVEVRLLRTGLEAGDVPPERKPLFGVFTLQRRSGDCGF